MELELGLALALPTPHHQPLAAGLLGGSAGACGRKRVLGEAFGAANKATLPLFVRDDGDGDGGGRDRDRDRDRVDHHHEPDTKKKRLLVGWPPVKCARRSGGGGGYVKVRMEGVAIGRKVDVSLHGSYQDLLRTLHRMFPSANQRGADSDNGDEEEVASHERRRLHRAYVVTYEDGDGDWLLVGDDVPWEVFVKSVKRLKILAQAAGDGLAH